MATYKIPESLTIGPLEPVWSSSHMSLSGVSLRPHPPTGQLCFTLLCRQSAGAQCAYWAGP